jgi:uncharacterized damage-inducible protein DinB
VQVTDALQDGFARLPGIVRAAVDRLDPDALTWRPSSDANPIGWLAWHLSRVQDDHVADVAGHDQLWLAGGWAPRFALDDGTTDTGFGWSPSQVATLRPESAEIVVRYLDEVTERTTRYLDTVSTDDLDRVVDAGWDPPVTLGTRLVSVLADDLQHAGQAAYVRGLWDAQG